MNSVANGLKLNIPEVCKDIEKLVKETMESLERDGAVVGISGGLDSAVTAALAVRSLGTERVHFFNFPDKDSKPVHKKHAKNLAKHLGVKLKTRSITPIMRASRTYRILPIGLIPSRKIRGVVVSFARKKVLSSEESDAILSSRLKPKANSWIAKGNAYAATKHRIRMILLYQYAEIHNLMVIGAANKTEWLTGTFSKWGVDHCADIMPLIHIYRSQLEEIAEFLDIPEYIRSKYADPDVLPGVEDKGQLLGSFLLVDQVLIGSENGKSLSELYSSFGQKNVDKVLQLKELSAQMRESPYHI